jgi:hypothetical protein
VILEQAAPARGGRSQRGALLPVALWLAAALVSGFTARRYLEPFDEGLLLQAATRVAAGQWPYADFGWSYGPGQPLLIALAFKLLGPSVIWWRLVRVAADATAALLAWRLTDRAAGPRWALAAWAAAALVAAQPTSANPAAVAFALALGALAVATGGERASPRRAAGAGALAALAGFWRPDFGLVAIAAVAAALLVRRERSSALTATAGSRRSARRRPAGGTRGAVVAAGTALAGTVLLWAPFAVVAGPGELWDVFVAGPSREGGSWSLPFPLVYDGPLRAWPPGDLATDVKDLLGYELPLAGVVALAAAVLTLRRRTISPVLAGLLALGAGMAVYLFSRPDEQHAQPLLIAACAFVAIALAARPARPLAAVLALALALLLAVGAANRLSALVLPPDLEPVRLDGVPGIRVPPDEARALPPLVALVQRLVPPGDPIYVAPRRSDLVTLSAPLVHFLVDRPNLLEDDVLLQARPAEQRRIVAALRRGRPRVVVRWTDPISSRPEPNARGRPSGSRALDEHLASAYRLRARFGAYDVLVPR